MNNLVIVAGRSGTGKSTSAENLNPDETFLLSTTNQLLPIRGCKNLYNKEKKNYATTTDYKQIIKLIKHIDNEMPHIKTILIDDADHVMIDEYMERAEEGGYNKFAEIGAHMGKVLKAARNVSRKDLKVVAIFHEEWEYSDVLMREVVKIRTAGKMVDRYFDPREFTNTVLWTRVKQDKEGNNIYEFITNAHGPIDAKSPKGMFEEKFIPNDLAKVLEQIDKYENEK